MQLPQDAMLLRIYLGERDRHEGKPLYEAIVAKARELRLAGATVLRGSMGYGRNAHIHRANLLDISEDLPVVLEIVESRENVDRLLVELEPLMGSGIATLEEVSVIFYGSASEHGPRGTGQS